MKTLAEEIIDLMAFADQRVTIAYASDRLAVEASKIRDAFHNLNKTSQADLVRQVGSRELFVVKPWERFKGVVNVCPKCGKHYEKTRGQLNRRSSRGCSLSCSLALSWEKEDAAPRKEELAERQRSEEARARMSAERRVMMNDPRRKEKQSVRSKEQWKNPEYRAKTTRGLRAVLGDEKHRKESSERLKRKWSDPSHRERVVQSLRSYSATPEATAKRRAASKKVWSDPQYKARETEKARARNSSKEFRETMSRLASEHWADPECKAARIAKVRATRAKTRSYRRSPEKLAIMKEMLSRGASCVEIGAVIGESGSYVWQWAKDVGIRTQTRSDACKKRMADPVVRANLSAAVSAAKKRKQNLASGACAAVLDDGSAA